MKKEHTCAKPKPKQALQNTLARPGLEVSTVEGVCTLLYPVYPGRPLGSWIGVLMDGKTMVITQEDIKEVL